MKFTYLSKCLPILIGILGTINCLAQNAKINLSKAKDLIRNEEYNLALHYLDLAIEEDSTCIEAFKERASVYHLLGKYKLSIEDYQFVITKSPMCSSCYFGLGNLFYIYHKDNYQAIEFFTKCINIALKDEDFKQAGKGYFMRAQMKKKLGDLTGYEADIELGAGVGDDACATVLKHRK